MFRPSPLRLFAFSPFYVLCFQLVNEIAVKELKKYGESPNVSAPDFIYLVYFSHRY